MPSNCFLNNDSKPQNDDFCMTFTKKEHKDKDKSSEYFKCLQNS